jgi:hypothetical protein
MRLLALATSLIAICALAAEPEPRAQATPAPGMSAEIKPPFGLAWGEDQARMERLIANVKASIASREQTGSGEEWHVTGLQQQGLKETRFRFVDGSLSAVTLVYERAEWSDAELLKFFHEVRQRLERRYGPPMKPNYRAADGNDPELCWRRDAIIRLQRKTFAGVPGQLVVTYAR